jgi:hypothetical protein
MRHELDAREYKLLLKPERFSQASSQEINHFWNERIIPLIDGRLGLQNDGDARYEGHFSSTAERIVRYWDTRECILTRADLTLRERRAAGSLGTSGLSEITPKLRMPDLFVVAGVKLGGNRPDARTKFEEDIAPLEVDDPNPGRQSVVISPVRSIRSRFSLSTTQSAEWNEVHAALGNAQTLFPTLRDYLLESGAAFQPETALIAGPLIRERVFKGARVRLGAGVIGKFALTLWYFDRPVPKVAELSFKCETAEGDMAGKAARRALTLFTGMQSNLGGWVNSEYSSKTALAVARQLIGVFLNFCGVRHVCTAACVP